MGSNHYFNIIIPYSYVKGVVRDILHDPGRGAPLLLVDFKDPYKYKKESLYFLASEGTHSG